MSEHRSVYPFIAVALMIFGLEGFALARGINGAVLSSAFVALGGVAGFMLKMLLTKNK